MANPSVIPKVPRHGSVLFFDNAGPGGSNTFGGPSATYAGAKTKELSGNLGAKPEMVHVRIRGKWVATLKGDDPIIEVTFQVPFFQFTNEGQDSLLDVLNGRGNITRAAGSNWTKDLETIEEWNTGVQFSASATGDAASHTWTARGAIWTWDWGETTNGETTVDVTGTIPDFDRIVYTGPLAA
ncbi:MAG: hypothetical protein AAFV53_00225 [Myxococcota bacterium]